MPVKTTKRTAPKSDSKKTKTSVKKSGWKTSNPKKVVVKKRTSDLTPTKASAAAIASQANRAKKQELINKLASGNKKIWKSNSSTKIPSWVWLFFWCALILFCVSFYQAIIRPQIEEWNQIWTTNHSDKNVYWTSNQDFDLNDVDVDINDNDSFESDDLEPVIVPEKLSADWLIQSFFASLSNHEFDTAFGFLTPRLQSANEMKKHFTSFRMDPFLAWIEWEKLEPTNIRYVSTSDTWKDTYSFDLSYLLKSNQNEYNETREFIVDKSWSESKIASIMCITTKCSYHPIFWPENFGLML